MRCCIIALLLAAVIAGTSADGATKAQCRSACTAFVAACRTDDCSPLAGKKSRRCAKRCRKQSERRCRHTGVQACALPDLPDPPDPPDPPKPSASKYYSGIDLGTLGGPGSTATALNDDGDVVGTSQTTGYAVRGFIWSGGVMKGLGTFGGQDSRAFAINNLGHVAGFADGVAGTALFLYRDGTMTNLAPAPCPWASHVGISDADRIVSSWYSCVLVVPPIPLPTSPWLSIADVNAAGLMVGSTGVDAGGGETQTAAIFTADGVVTPIGTLAGPAYPVAWSKGEAINNRGDVAGTSQTDLFALHAFLYADGTMIDLGSRGLVNVNEIPTALDVNDRRQVLWDSDARSSDKDLVTFLYDHETGSSRPVASLVDPTLGWTVTSAAAINARGQIAATAFTGPPVPHAVLLTPPE